MGLFSNKQINKGEMKYGMTTMLKTAGGGSGSSSASLLMFRIIVRSKGPRNTVSYTETYISASTS